MEIRDIHLRLFFSKLSHICPKTRFPTIAAYVWISQLAPRNSLPAISGKTNCKVTHFFLIADYCHVGFMQISLQERCNLPARMARLRHTSYGTRARTGCNELVRRMKRGLAPNDASRIKRRFCSVF